MSNYLFLYKGFVTPTPEIGRAWMQWFTDHGDRMIDSGKPMSGGVEVTPLKVEELSLGLDSYTGYSIIEANSKDEAIALAGTNPMITSVIVYDLAKM